MNLNSSESSLQRTLPCRFTRNMRAAIAILAIFPAVALADAHGKTPEGKVYVSSVHGASQITQGDHVEALAAKSYYKAQGARLETKPAGTAALVLSNGTGLALNQDTHIEVKRFTQEPFVASRTDLESEPSTSQTVISVSQGTLAVSTSKLSAGSSMTFLTPLGSINLHGGNLVIAVEDGRVTISLLAGSGTVQGGDLDLGGHVLHAGEQAVIRPGPPGRPNIVEISKIPGDQQAALDADVAVAYAARKTVYFETDATGDVSALPVVDASVPVQATVSPSRLPR